MSRSTNLIHAAFAGLFLVGTALVIAQPTRKAPAHRTTRTRRQQTEAKPAAPKFVFGDVTVTGFANLSGSSASIIAVGPNTTVESTDPNGGSTRIVANRFVATMGKNRGVDKIEAIGSVKFFGERPMPEGKGRRVLNGTGSHGTYYKQEGRLVLEGPVSYDVRQPSASGKEEWARGTSDSASYDENKKVLTLSGDVRAKYYDPENMAEGKPSDLQGDRVTLDFSGAQVQFNLQNNNPSGGRIEIHPKQPEKRETTGKGKT